MEEQVYKKYDAGQVTDTMLQEAAVLFSENYGFWASKRLVNSQNQVSYLKLILRSSAN